MIGLMEACQRVLDKNPNKHIHCVNEFDDLYQFIMINDGESIEEVSFICDTPMISKKSGELKDGTILDSFKMGDYVQYTREQIESILDVNRKAS